MEETNSMQKRRNLMILSLILFFLSISEIGNPEINILGLKFKIEKEPFDISSLILIMFTYSFFRFLQELTTTKDDNKDTYRIIDKIIELFQKKIVHYTKEKYIKLNIVNKNDEQFGNFEYKSWKEVVVWYQIKREDNKYDNNKFNSIEKLSFWNRFIILIFSLYSILIKETIISEYIFPLIFSFFVLIYFIYNKASHVGILALLID